MKRKAPSKLRTWIEIDRRAIASNFKTISAAVTEGAQRMAVVKSNAYGHGLVEFSREIEGLGGEWLGVDSIVEAVRLREEGVKLPILVLGYTLPENYADAVRLKISIAVSSLDQLNILIRTKLPCVVHLKIDTGMHRQGFFPDQMTQVAHYLKRASQITVEGIFTHLAGKDPYNLRENHLQIERFDAAVEALRVAGLTPLRHVGATWGTFAFPEAHFEIARSGIALYGHWPTSDTAKLFGKKARLVPALTWKTVLSEVKTIPRTAGVGYDFSEIVPAGTKIAICPVGYWHGYPRALSSIGEVLVRGKRAKLVGRVSMDMITIDVSGISGVRMGDEVVLIGKQGKDELTAEEIVSWMPGSSVYELLTRINPLIRRIYE